MSTKNTSNIAKVLKIMIVILLICNILALIMVPGAVAIKDSDLSMPFPAAIWKILVTSHGGDSESLSVSAPVFMLISWVSVWNNTDAAILAAFLLLCGICTALILLQASKILDSIIAGTPFSRPNAQAMFRAAICFFIISAAAFARMVIILFRSGFTAILSYNTLFIPVFLIGGLLCTVMSALFRQATELKEDNDLVI